MKTLVLSVARAAMLAGALPAAAQTVNQAEPGQEQRIHQAVILGALTRTEAQPPVDGAAAHPQAGEKAQRRRTHRLPRAIASG